MHLFSLEKENLAGVELLKVTALWLSHSLGLSLGLLAEVRPAHPQGLCCLQQCCSGLTLFGECGPPFLCEFPHLSAQIE